LSARSRASRMVGVPITVHLLGPPLLVRDGVVFAAPRGRKVWALLAYLALSLRHPADSNSSISIPRRRGQRHAAVEPVGADASGRTRHGGSANVVQPACRQALGSMSGLDGGRPRGGQLPDSDASCSGMDVDGPASPRLLVTAVTQGLSEAVLRRERLHTSGHANAVELATRLVAASVERGRPRALVRAFAATATGFAQRQLAASPDLFRRAGRRTAELEAGRSRRPPVRRSRWSCRRRRWNRGGRGGRGAIEADRACATAAAAHAAGDTQIGPWRCCRWGRRSCTPRKRRRKARPCS
jgi:hypothetical protein